MMSTKVTYFITSLNFGGAEIGMTRLIDGEGVIELLSHCDDRTSRIVSAFIIGDCNNEAKAQR